MRPPVSLPPELAVQTISPTCLLIVALLPTRALPVAPDTAMDNPLTASTSASTTVIMDFASLPNRLVMVFSPLFLYFFGFGT